MTLAPPSPSGVPYTRFPTKQQMSEIRNPTKREVLDQQYVLFSFEHFQQQDYLGLGQQKKQWFIALLDRLKNLAGFTVSALLHDNHGDKSLRCHGIDFEAKGCPFRLEDFSHVPDGLLLEGRNLYQISISKTFGRIIGVFMPGGVFSIVALDPLHNMQPSKRNDYRVRNTHIASTPYSALRIGIEKIDQGPLACENCKVSKELKRLLKEERENTGVAFCCRVDDEDLRQINEGIERHTLETVLMAGIMHLEERG